MRRGTRASPKGLQPKQLLGAPQRFALAWRLRPAVTKARVRARFLAVCLGCWLPSHPVAGSELDSAERTLGCADTSLKPSELHIGANCASAQIPGAVSAARAGFPLCPQLCACRFPPELVHPGRSAEQAVTGCHAACCSCPTRAEEVAGIALFNNPNWSTLYFFLLSFIVPSAIPRYGEKAKGKK